MAKAAERTTARIETPQSKDNPAEVKIEEIPLPPEALWADLENSGAGKEPNEATNADAPKRAPLPAERLAFLRDGSVPIPLEFPFEWNGETVDTITMRRLTVGESGDLIDHLPSDFDFYDFYAAMCGLPAPVLRGLIDVDGQKIADVGYGFLPRQFRPATESSSES